MSAPVLEPTDVLEAPRSDLPPRLDEFGAELDAIRQRVLDDLGERDADYIHKMIKAQRSLESAVSTGMNAARARKCGHRSMKSSALVKMPRLMIKK